MSDESLNEDQKLKFDYGSRLFDLYIITQGGMIRRTALPLWHWSSSAWLMSGHNDIEPEFFDRNACEQAEYDHCGYAEALLVVVDTLIQGMAEKFIATCSDREAWEIRQRAFEAEQKRRERLWREAHNEWGKDLPPCLD